MRSMVLGLLVGVIIGLSLGMLVAPSSGTEARQKLRERAEPTLERVRARGRQARDREKAAA
ncbi:MAG: YtxH domain-containing protein [Chloroflexi bacterium]|nr:YtxH domain-containing protein [Chloroflexota bacterium]